jgi:hypothetical protein
MSRKRCIDVTQPCIDLTKRCIEVTNRFIDVTETFHVTKTFHTTNYKNVLRAGFLTPAYSLKTVFLVTLKVF